ncbi:MAG TPA: urea amidolyase associated protein UAAP1 [Stellaceae bacterium]|nr:urea amidolyase associated protein UAAP1 [Stellaceae bacterium]
MDVTAEERAEIDANRRRYEALKAAGTGKAPQALPPPTSRGEAPLDPASVLQRETIPGGWYTTLLLNRGDAVRVLNTTGKAAVAVLAWNRHDTAERINYADTIKLQWSTSLRKGRVIFSDMGRVLLSVREDTTGGAHDALVGGSTSESVRQRYGDHPRLRNTRDNFVLAAGKHGLGRRDIPSCITLFAPVGVDDDGHFTFDTTRRQPGDFVDLRAEMDLILALSTCPHPLDPAPSYGPEPVEIVRFRAPAGEGADLCRAAGIEAERGFQNTEAWLRS